MQIFLAHNSQDKHHNAYLVKASIPVLWQRFWKHYIVLLKYNGSKKPSAHESATCLYELTKRVQPKLQVTASQKAGQDLQEACTRQKALLISKFSLDEWWLLNA